MHWLEQQAPYHRDACNWWNWCVVCGCSVNDALVVIGFVVVVAAVLIKTVVVVGACVAILGVDVVDFDAFACVGVVAMAYDAADFVATIVLVYKYLPQEFSPWVCWSWSEKCCLCEFS